MKQFLVAEDKDNFEANQAHDSAVKDITYLLKKQLDFHVGPKFLAVFTYNKLKASYL